MDIEPFKARVILDQRTLKSDVQKIRSQLAENHKKLYKDKLLYAFRDNQIDFEYIKIKQAVFNEGEVFDKLIEKDGIEFLKIGYLLNYFIDCSINVATKNSTQSFNFLNLISERYK